MDKIGHLEFFTTPIFVSSIYTSYLNNIDVSKIKVHVQSVRKNSKSNIISNVGGFQSQAVVNEFDSDEVKKLFQENIFPAANYIVNNVWRRKINLDSFNYWYNINQKYNYNTTHSHNNCILSGVFYIDVPENSGNIVFVRNDYEQSMQIFALMKDEEKDFFSPDCSLHYSVTPKIGLLIIFPSHLKHFVDQNLSDKERISMSFNIL